ncbi:MAG: hypothetical protein K8S54_00470 [Spirochaetia bacterium]|nr:hypothetical protein [Spirochaetia bacterium]
MSSLRIKVTAAEGAHTIVPVLTVSGFVPPCAEGNAFIDELRPSIEKFAAENDGKAVILDFLDADYSFGDHFASLWIAPLLQHNCKVLIVADSTTSTSIRSLLAGMPVPIVGTLRDALMCC